MESPTTQFQPQNITPTQSPRHFSVLLVLLSLLVFLLLLSTSFLAYQNMQLRKRISATQFCMSKGGTYTEIIGKTPACNLPPGLNPPATNILTTYSHNGISFQYPSDWTPKPEQLSGSGWRVEINDPQNVYTFTFSQQGNYNQETGKPYADLKEYARMPYINPVTVAGLQADQELPRAGSENDNQVVFFSKDAKSIYTIELDTDRSRVDKVADGQKLFSQILSTFTYSDTIRQKQANSYVSQKAKLSMTFPQPMYVTETVNSTDGWQNGHIVISASNPNGDEELSNFTIVYGIPNINGKGGACDGESGFNYQTKTILGQKINNICDNATGLTFFAGYPTYPGGNIEYSFFIGGKNITTTEFQTYANILFNTLTFVK